MAANTTTTIHGSIQDRYNLQLPKSERKEIFGLEFPLGTSKSGGIFTKTSGIKMIRDAVQQLLLTERGERVMLPNYGCNLRRYLFQPLDQTTFENIRREIEKSFNNYILRVTQDQQGATLCKLYLR